MQIRVELLGAVTVTPDGDAPRYLESAQARVAFVRLVMGRLTGVTRHELADVIWPDYLPATWASALRSLVSRLRVFMRPVVPGVADPVVVRAGRYFLLLPEDADVDIEEAERAILAAHDRLDAGDLPAARQLGMEGTTRLRSPFLPDQDNTWVRAVREHLAELLVTGLETTSQAAAAAGDRRAPLLAHEATATQPLRESAHRALMAAHAALGNRGAALLAYQRLRRLLAEELGVDPSAETEAAYLALLGPATARPRARGPGRPRRDAPFVDRQRETRTVLDAWDRAVAGARQLIQVVGEVGIGKTRLVQESGRQIAAAGGLVLLGRSDPGSAVAYQPLVEAVAGLIAATPSDELPRLSPPTRAVLADMLQLDGTRPSRELPDPTRLFPAVTQLIVEAARRRPLALLLDDLQWADRETLLLLCYILRHSADVPLCVAAIARDDASHPHFLREELRRLDHAGRLTHLSLGGLDLPAIEELVEALIEPRSAAEGLAPRLYAETAGNPFMLLELLHHHLAAGGIVGDGSPVPRGIVDLVATKMARLDDRTQQLVQTAALCRSEFEFDVAARAAGLDEPTALDALDLALGAGLVVETVPEEVPADGPPVYRFRHGVVRRVVSAQLSEARRRHLHDRLVAAASLAASG